MSNCRSCFRLRSRSTESGQLTSSRAQTISAVKEKQQVTCDNRGTDINAFMFWFCEAVTILKKHLYITTSIGHLSPEWPLCSLIAAAEKGMVEVAVTMKHFDSSQRKPQYRQLIDATGKRRMFFISRIDSSFELNSVIKMRFTDMIRLLLWRERVCYESITALRHRELIVHQFK